MKVVAICNSSLLNAPLFTVNPSVVAWTITQSTCTTCFRELNNQYLLPTARRAARYVSYYNLSRYSWFDGCGAAVGIEMAKEPLNRIHKHICFNIDLRQSVIVFVRM